MSLGSAPRLAPAITGTSVAIVGFDDAREHVQQRHALRFGQRCQQPLLGGEQRWTQSAAKFCPTSGDKELTGPAIGRIDLAFDQTFLLEDLDHLSEVHGIDAHTVSQMALAASRLFHNSGHDAKQQWRQILAVKDFGGYPEADLIKPASQCAGTRCEASTGPGFSPLSLTCRHR